MDVIGDDVVQFLQDIESGRQKFNRGESAHAAAVAVLTAPEEVRFYATLEDDRVGGFRRSSMTPGKQALFALTLILNESQEPWPLLIDQPEDDLDSRSMYESIVPYLLKAKRERQIIMVTHDANLAIGADSEQIVVTNRHGHDRKNRDEKFFDYFTGSLENTSPRDPAVEHVLESCGVREHACELLDGGEEAFRKRKEKYRL